MSHGVAAAGAGPAHRLGEAPPRFPELDGIRGFAALAVLLFHVGPESFGAVMPELRSPWVFPWINGHRAVLLFFVLSGDALASACLRAASPAGIARLALRRYVRLTGPIVLSSLIIYGLMKYGLMFHREAAQQVASPWLWGFLNFEPTFAGLFIYTLRDVYFGFAAPTPYNGFLWTMMVELSGSYYVFLACFMLPYVKRPPYLVALVAALMLAFGSYYGLFFVGVLFALWRRDGLLGAFRRSHALNVVAFLCPLLLYVADARWPIAPGGSPERHQLVACLIVLSLYVSAPYRWLFSTRFADWLGTLSFPLYLLQEPVLLSLVSFIVAKYYRYGTPFAPRVLMVAMAAGVVATFVGARLLLVAERAIVPRLERRVVRWLV